MAMVFATMYRKKWAHPSEDSIVGRRRKAVWNIDPLRNSSKVLENKANFMRPPWGVAAILGSGIPHPGRDATTGGEIPFLPSFASLRDAL